MVGNFGLEITLATLYWADYGSRRGGRWRRCNNCGRVGGRTPAMLPYASAGMRRWTRRGMRRWTRRWTGRCAISLIACDRLVQRGVFKRRQCPSVVLEPTRRRRPTASPTTDQCSCDSQPREALCSHRKCSHRKSSHQKCSHERLPPKVLEVSNCRCDRSSNDLKTLFPTL